MATPTSPDNAVSGPALDNRRIAAAAIDVAAPVLAAVAVAAAGLLTPAVALVLVGWTLYYFFAFESGAGQTLGKRMMSLKVVAADGGEPTMRQYAMRTLARVVDMPVIGLIVMLVTGDKRERLGDMAARTSIVDANATDRAPDAFDLAPLQAEPVAPKAKRSRPSLGGPALKLPSFGRSKAPGAPEAPEPAKAKKGRPTLGGPELKLPSFGRKKAKAPAFPGPATPVPEEIVTEPEAPVGESPVAQPEPLPASPPEPVPEVKPFDPFAEDAPEPSVEVVAYGEPEPEPDAPELPAPEIMQRDEPEVEIVRDDPADEPPAPEPMTPTLPAEPPPAAAEYEQPLEPEPEPEPETEPEPESESEHVEGIRDDGSSRVNVKPIETVSAMELLMRETEEQDRQGG